MTDGPETARYLLDGRHATREEFYRVACDPACSVVVEACAGAGKTWMLVSRIVRALLAGAQPQEILAITFTNKAAGEMRARLTDWLRSFALEPQPHTLAAQLIQRGVAPAQAHAQAPELAQLFQRVLASGQAVEVRTFHAWFLQLLRQAPFQVLDAIGLQPHANLLDEEQQDTLATQAWAALMAELATASGTASPQAMRLQADFNGLVHAIGRQATQSWLMNVLRVRVAFEQADAAGVVEASVPGVAETFPDLAGLAHPHEALSRLRWRELFESAAAVLGQGAIKAQKAAQGIAEALVEPDPARAWPLLCKALLTQKGEPLKLVGDPAVSAAQDAVLYLQRACEQQAVQDRHAAVTRLARGLLRHYGELKRRRQAVDYEDLDRVALRLLGDEALSGWLLQRMDLRIRHVLIDEFQDTSPMQWQALSAWLGSYAGAGGGASGQHPPSVFVVGDPKQSIYRFRRADPRVFEAAKVLVQEGLAGRILACDHTHRCTPEVLGAVNAVFAQARADSGYSAFRPHSTEMKHGPGGVWALPRIAREPSGADKKPQVWRDTLNAPRREREEARRMREARAVAAAIRALLDGHGPQGCMAAVAPRDILVLSRRRAMFVPLLQALREQHVPCQAPDGGSLADAIEVRDLTALLDVLASPGHDLSLAHALRSPIFGVPDADLSRLHAHAQDHGGCRWWEALQALPQPSPALARAGALLRAWAAAAAWLPPHDLLDRIFAEGDLHARYAAAVPAWQRDLVRAQLDAVLQVSLGLDGGRHASPYGLVRALKRRALPQAQPAQDMAVRLMTIHGAKGLEAPVVFLVDADPEAARPDTGTVLVDWPVHSQHPARFAFLASEGVPSEGLRAALEQEQAARRLEELNGLYVAMTRAAQMLIVSATQPLRPDGAGSWWSRLEPVARPWADVPAAKPQEERASAALRVSTRPWLPRASQDESPAVVEPDAPDQDETARIGLAVHRVLEWCTREPAALSTLRARIARRVAQACASCGVSPQGHAQVRTQALAIFEDPQVQRWFGGEGLRWAGNEVELQFEGRILRLDRLVHREEGWWVLDYKSHPRPHEQPALVAQLAAYVHAVRQTLARGEAVQGVFLTGEGRAIVLDEAP